MEEQKVHVFEKAGLGKAPFHYLGSYEDRGPHDLGNGIQVGAPGQPMGTCQYCGQGIAICCRIKSFDGREFIVGSDCVLKTGDKGLRKAVNKDKTKARHVREDRLIEEGKAFVEQHRGALEGRRFVEGATYTILESFDWYMGNAFYGAGRSGKLRMINNIKRYVKENSLG